MTQTETAANPGTVLFVDDEPNILNALKRLFRPTGLRVLTAPGGQEGLNLLDAETVDVVVSDMRMPQMDGAAFLKAVRERHPGVERILLTGFADMESTVSAVNDGGISRYLNKPWKDHEILTTVKDAVDRRRLQAEVARLHALTAEQNTQLKTMNTELETRVLARTRDLQTAIGKIKEANESLKQNFLTTVRVFSDLVEMRSGHMAGHSRRVAQHARSLAKAAGLDEVTTQNIMLAGLLHDIGKIGLPDELLGKPYNSFKADERSLYIRHAERGEAALTAVSQLKAVCKLVRHHHEMWDGSGFPDNLVGLAIPIGAQILAIANDYDGLMQGQLTARPLPAREALVYISQNAGKRYNPELANTFVRMLSEASGRRADGISLRPGMLKQGMRLAQDLLHPDGYLLLPKGHVCDEDSILQLRRLETSSGRNINVQVEDSPRGTSS
ncbi:response regulator [Zoogloeaceae bacterium G21618-S1]|nr:response regulator [Zoogloeaceae bacterium G21618-S1]